MLVDEVIFAILWKGLPRLPAATCENSVQLSPSMTSYNGSQ